MDDDDLQELRLIFLDECLENIELLEQGLMRMDDGEDDADTLNEVFRAAHSIKGGAATFGFLPMSEITHHMETLLEEMRSGRRQVTSTDVDLLLTGLDVVQQIQNDSRTGENADHPDRLTIQQSLELAVATSLTTSSDEETEPTAVEFAGAFEQTNPSEKSNPSSQLSIRFVPNSEFIRRGNDSLLLLRELARIGDLQILLNETGIPEWEGYEPTVSYLSWQLELRSSATEADVREIFEWVDTDCVLEIISLADQSEPVSATIPSASVADQVQGADECTTGSNEHGAPTAKTKKTVSQKSKNTGESSSIRIATDKIDQLINLVGELVITQSMLSRVSSTAGSIDLEELHERMADLEHNTRDLQESVMQVRMLPLSSAFSRLPRLVRDLSRKLGKEVDLVFEGGSTELDKTVLERMIDPLVHLVRNALDHGLETPAQREAAGKPPVGRLTLSARQESGSVVIEIVDDGHGINPEIIVAKAREKGIVAQDEVLTDDQINQLIFAPGFSTAEEVSDVSGRGVGMDVVRRNILDLSGRVQVRSTLGKGTKIEINLPLSLAILDGQLVKVSDQVFVIPILSIIETVEMRQTEVSDVPGTGELFRFRGEYLSMLRVAEHFNIPGQSAGGMIVVVDTHGQLTGLVIDEVLGQQQVVIKPLDKNYKSVRGLAGATIMSDGSVALILDPANVGDAPQLANAA